VERLRIVSLFDFDVDRMEALVQGTGTEEEDGSDAGSSSGGGVAPNAQA
jgi:hypothetical protein